MTFQDACSARVAEDFLRVGARKRVARDSFAAFNALQKKRVPRTLRDSQIGADGRQQICGKHVIDRDEVSLLREALKFTEVRLDHRSEFTVDSLRPKVKRASLLHRAWLMLVRLLSQPQGAEHGAAHGSFRCTLFHPNLPLSYALREKHLHAGDGMNAFLCGDLQELSPLWPVDQVHRDPTV